MTSRTTRYAAVALVAVHLIAALAGFLAPHDFAEQNRNVPFAPPTVLHFVDANGDFHLRPFVYGIEPSAGGGYREAREQTHAVRLFARGTPYRLLGIFSASRHLISVDAPGRLFLLGTDGLGRDLYSRLLHGSRVSLFAGLLGASLALAVGGIVGILAGFYGGRVDRLLMSTVEVFMALPWLYLLIAARAFQPLETPPAQAFLIVVLVLGCFGWPRSARLIRGVALSAREREFVQASRGFGASDLHLMARHLLPQTASVALTQGALLVPQFILAEVTLSFLGIGINPPIPSWGNMLGELQRFHVLTSSWWWMASPAIALMVVVLCYQVLARGATVRTGKA